MDTISSNINSISIDVISDIQRELDLVDVRSLVFILYDVPYTALERLTLLQRIPRDRENFDLLDDWAKQAQSRPTWRYEFLEALTLCQLYSIIKKLGFDIKTVKLHFLPDNIHTSISINLMKKMLYKLCEHMRSDNLNKLKATLSRDIDVREYETCELILLKLMCSKFIKLESNKKCQIERLCEIIQSLPEMGVIASELREIQRQINLDFSRESECEILNKIISSEDGTSRNVSVRNMTQKLKTDKINTNLKGAYEILNKNRLGLCYIINQETFYQCEESKAMEYEPLEHRQGSSQDTIQLKRTMEALNFKVIIDDNLSQNDIFQKLKNIVNTQILEEDSMFVLCILSHGIEGCIYSSDSLPVKVRDLQVLLDKEEARNLIGKPKILIIQACQAAQEAFPQLVSDGPTRLQHIGKSDFLILWATVPEYLAFRDSRKGSIFIQILCLKIRELASEEHLDDIFKSVNDDIINLCTKHNCKQVAMSQNTLRKKLYLKLLDSQ